MDIVFNVNPLGMEGLGPTLTSLIRHCSNSSELHLWFLCSELNTKDKENILYLLREEHFKGHTDFVDFNAKEKFGHLKSLHGDWTTYGRLMIPQIIKSKYALYLDSDLIICVDVLQLKEFHFVEILAAVYGSNVQYALENPFFINKLNWSPNTGYFNAGVLLFNIPAWKKNDIERKINEIADLYPNEFLSADQTLLNAVCVGEFAYLPDLFNQSWYPRQVRPKDVNKSITHFVGSPKPWDLFGKLVHTGYSIFLPYNTSFWSNKYGRITAKKLVRTYKIRRSILKYLIGKIKTKFNYGPNVAGGA